MRKLTTEDFIAKAKAKHGELYDYSEVVYINNKHKIILKCNRCGYKYKCSPSNHLSGTGCKKCAYKDLPQNQPITNSNFIILANTVHNNKFEYLSPYITSKKKIKIKCKSCQQIFEQRPSSHLLGMGCNKCQYKNLPQNKPMTTQDFENKCKIKHYNRYEYFGDYKGRKYKIKILCKKHNIIFYQQAGNHIQGRGCPKCSSSKGELRISEYLIRNKINFEYFKTFIDCRDKSLLSFDFYLPQQNICIEYDGEQHFYPIAHFGGDKRFNETQLHDKIKTEYCINNNINLVRIAFYDFDYIDNILDSLHF